MVINKPRISKKKSIDFIVKHLEKGTATTDIVGDMLSKFKMSDTSVYNHLKEARDIHSERENKRRKALEEVEMAEEKKARQKGLKTRFDRLFELQNDYDAINRTIEKGITKDTLIQNGHPKTFERPLTESEKERLYGRKQSLIKQIQDMEADALPVTTNTNVNLTDTTPTTIIFR